MLARCALRVTRSRLRCWLRSLRMRVKADRNWHIGSNILENSKSAVSAQHSAREHFGLKRDSHHAMSSSNSASISEIGQKRIWKELEEWKSKEPVRSHPARDRQTGSPAR